MIIYIGCVILLGIPVMLAEFSIGRAGKSDAIGSMKSLGAGKGWRSFGGLSIMAAYLILSFYMVVVGWTVEYLWESITGELYANVGPDMKSTFAGHMKEYISDTWTPMVATVIMIVINIGVLLGGVQKGIERLSNWLMPVLFVLLVVFCIRALSFEKALEGYTFFLRPDWSVVTSGTFISALGQAFFSLSLGMGVLVTYSSYFPGDTNLTKTAVTVSLLDLLVAVMMGLIIFPAVMSFGLNGEGIEGATLVFVTLPEVFMQMHGTQIWSILFFLLLAVAALTSTISVAEVAVACIRDRFKVSRLKAVLIVMLPLFVISPICSLSQGALSGVTIFRLSIFTFLDTLATNVLLPVVSIGLCIWLGWFAPKGLLSDQLSNAGSLKTRLALPIRFIIRWIAPLLILTVFICGFL